MTVGIPLIPHPFAVSGFSSTSILTTLMSPIKSRATASTFGAIILQGAHQVAQKLAKTGSTFSITDDSNSWSVTSAIRAFLLGLRFFIVLANRKCQFRDHQVDRKSTRLNSSHTDIYRM